VRRLAVGLGRDEHVDADLEPRRLVDDLVSTAGLGEAARGRVDVEALHARDATTEHTKPIMATLSYGKRSTREGAMRGGRWIIGVLAALGMLATAAPIAAKDGDVVVRGTCTKASTSKLKLSEEDGRIEVEFEVDQNRNGVRWTVTLRRPTTVLLRTTRVTRAPSGSFEVRRVVGDLAGPDRITARATSPSGEVCTATGTFR
jgi:hypothetical protein